MKLILLISIILTTFDCVYVRDINWIKLFHEKSNLIPFESKVNIIQNGNENYENSFNYNKHFKNKFKKRFINIYCPGRICMKPNEEDIILMKENYPKFWFLRFF